MSEPDLRELQLLQRWERGDLSSEELARQAPEAAQLTELFTRLQAYTTAEVPPVNGDWKSLSARLPDRATKRTRGARWFARPLLAAAIVVGMTGAVALAGPQIGHQFGRVIDTIQGWVGRSHTAAVVPHPSSSVATDSDRPSPRVPSSPSPDVSPKPKVTNSPGSGGDKDGTSSGSPTTSGDGSGSGSGDNTQGSTTGSGDQGGGSSGDQGGSGDSGSGSGDSSGGSGSDQGNQSGGGQNS